MSYAHKQAKNKKNKKLFGFIAVMKSSVAVLARSAKANRHHEYGQRLSIVAGMDLLYIYEKYSFKTTMRVDHIHFCFRLCFVCLFLVD